MTRAASVCLAAVLTIGSTAPLASDWPEFRGEGRRGVWTETGILQTFPSDGLRVLWRTPVKEGYSSPVVADGRIFLTDFARVRGVTGPERALALDEKTGEVLWTVEWEATYAGYQWPNGPRATPTVDGDRLYVLGANGVLQCLDVETGAVRWKKDYAADYGIGNNGTGAASAPIVEGNLLISIVGAEPDGLVLAWDKFTGDEVWRSIEVTTDPGVGTPIIITEGGVRQLIIWTPDAVRSLDPATGRLLWELPFRSMAPMNIAVPVITDHKLLVSNFYTGSMLAELDQTKPAATMLWKGQSGSEIDSDGLHAVIGAPIIIGDHLYGTCSYGQLRAIDLSTGERVWETQAVTNERARWASAHIVRHGDRVFISNDRGDLIIARLTPEGYQELDRTHLLKPTSPPGIRRQLDAVTVVHPAYANQHIYMRNDEEIVAVTLAAADYREPFDPSLSSSSGTTTAPVAAVAAAASEPERAVDIQYIPSLSFAKKSTERDAEYSSVYMLLGGGPHSLAFSSDNGVVLVNTKSPGWGSAIQDKLPLITEAPVTAIINTHPGVDYTGSNSAFPDAATIVAHERTRAAMAALSGFAGPNARFLPNRVFTDQFTLFEGKNRVDVYHFGVAHTDGDAVVVIPISNLAYLGELFPAKAVPVIDTAHGGSAVAFADTLTRALEVLREADVQFIVPGRSEPRFGGLQVSVMSMRDLEEYVDFNRDLRQAVREAAESGKTVDEAVASLSLPGQDQNYDMQGARAYVQALYGELNR